MLRRVPAAVLLLALLLRGAASLHACEAARAAAAPPADAVDAPREAHAGHGDPPRACDRRHAGRCPHAGEAAFHPCQTDPAAGLAAAPDAALPAAGDAALPPLPGGEPRPPAAETAPGPAPLPEAPPPRSLA